MSLLENGNLIGQGREAGLFLPEPDISLDPGKPLATTGCPKSLNEALHDAVEDAKQNPDSARQLFNLMTLYRSDDDDHVRRVRNNFTELGIPLEFLSH